MEEHPSEDNKEEVLSGLHGEYRIPRRSFINKFEDSLSSLFAHVIEGRYSTISFGCIMMIISFLQNLALFYNPDLGLVSEIEDYPIVEDFFLSTRIIGIAKIFKSRIVFLFTSYVLFIFLIIYILLLWLVSLSDDTPLGSTGLTTESANVMSHIIYWIFVVPMTESFFTMLNCSKVEALGIVCQSQEHWINLIIIGILFVMFVITTYAISVYGITVNPYSPDAFTRYNWNFEELYLLFRIFLVFVSTFIQNDGQYWLVYVLLAISFLFFSYYYIKYIPYYNPIISVTFGACCLSYSWTSLALLFGNIINDIGIEYGGTQISVIIGIVIFSILSYFIRSYIIRSLLLWDNHFEISDECRFNLLMLNIIHLIVTPSDMLSQYDLLLRQGFTTVHKRECKDKSCPLVDTESEFYLPLQDATTQKNFFSIDDDIRLRLLICTMYKQNLLEAKIDYHQSHGKRKNEYMNKSVIERGPCTCLLFAYYVLTHVGNLQLAATQIALAETLSEGIKLKHLIRIAKMQLENVSNTKPRKILRKKDDINADNPSHNKNRLEYSMDPRKVIVYEEKFQTFESTILSTVKKHMEFWRELGNEKPDLQVLHDKGIAIIETSGKITLEWEELKSINKYYPVCDVLYGRYLKQVLGQTEEGEKYIKSANSMMETQKAHGSGFGTTQETMFRPQSMVLVVNGMENSMKNKVIKASNNIANLLGFAKTEIIGQDLELIIPEFYAPHHKNFVKKYFMTGKQRAIGKIMKTFAAHKSGYIVPVSILIKHYYDYHFESVFTAIITLEKTNNEYLVTNQLGLILGITEGSGEDFGGISPLMLAESEAYMYYFCPEMKLNPNNLREDYERIVGTVGYKCMIPRDANSVNAFIPLKAGFQEIRNMQKKMESKVTSPISRFKISEQRSSKKLMEGAYKECYKNCDQKFIEFNIENLDYPDEHLSLKIFAYRRRDATSKKNKKGIFSVSRIRKDCGSISMVGNECIINIPHNERKEVESPPKAILMGDKGFSLNEGELQGQGLLLRHGSFTKKKTIKDVNFSCSNTMRQVPDIITKQTNEEVKGNDLDKTRLDDKEADQSGVLPINDISSVHNPFNEADMSRVVPDISSTQLLSSRKPPPIPEEPVPPINLNTYRRGSVAVGERRVSQCAPEALETGGKPTPGTVNDKMVREIEKLRNCSYGRYNPPLLSYLNILLGISLLATLAATITIFAFENNTSTTIRKFTQAMNITRLDSILQISEVTRSLVLTTPRNIYGNALINNEQRSLNYNYSSFCPDCHGFLSYIDWKRMILKNSADYLMKVEQDILWLNELDLDRKTIQEINAITSAINYPSMENQDISEFGHLHTSVTQFVNQAYKLYNYPIDKISEDDLIISFLLNNGLYLLERDSLNIAEAIHFSVDSQMKDRELRNLIEIVIIATFALIKLVALTIILYKVKTQKAELLKSLFDITKSRISAQARACGQFCRNADINTNIDDAIAPHNQEIIQMPKETTNNDTDENMPLASEGINKSGMEGISNGDKTKSSLVGTKEYREYIGKFKMNLIKTMIFLIVELVYFIQNYFRPIKSYEAIQKNIDELLRVKSVYKDNMKVYAYMIELLGTSRDTRIGNALLKDELFEKLTNLTRETKELQEIHTKNNEYYISSYNNLYSHIMENDICDMVLLQDSNECKTIEGGVLRKGLTLANAAYLHELLEVMNDYLNSRTLRVEVLSALINDPRLVTNEIIGMKYLQPFYMKLGEGVIESISGIMDNKVIIDEILFGFFIGYLLICYLLMIYSMANSVKQDLFSTYSLFGILPTEIILQTPRIKNYLLKSVSDIDSSTS